ncbi:MAG: enoyl-CoA hydratase/isomerase family protein [Bryobacteraceae bacterium]
MSELVETALEGRLLRLTLNRPEKRNALNIALCRALVEELDRAEADRHIGGVLLAANGPAFCAGMDLDEMASGPDLDEMNDAHEQLFTFGARITKPVVAAVDGPALAGGTGLAANCHIVAASDRAAFGLTEIRLGLWPFTIFRAVSLAVGERRAVELSLTGRVFGASEALEFGLIHYLEPDPLARALEIARELSSASLTAVRSGLYFVQETRGKAWKQAGEIAARVRKQVFTGADVKEGLKAFHGKHPPKWPSIAS